MNVVRKLKSKNKRKKKEAKKYKSAKKRKVLQRFGNSSNLNNQ